MHLQMHERLAEEVTYRAIPTASHWTQCVSMTRIACITLRTLQAHPYPRRAGESLVKDSNAHP